MRELKQEEGIIALAKTKNCEVRSTPVLLLAVRALRNTA
jgi:hypothetical protein